MAQPSSSFKPFVVLFGTEDFFLDRDLERVRVGKREVIEFDAGEGLSDVALVESCEAYSANPRTIIVENAQKIKFPKGSKALETFIEERDPRDTNLILVAVIRGEKLPSIWDDAAAKGKRVERKKFRAWDNDSYLDFIRNEATRLKVVLGKDVATTLFDYVGTDLYRLENELRKLAVYVGQAHTINREHITLVTSPTPKADVFKVVEAALSKEAKSAMNLFSIYYLNEGDNGLIPLVGALMKQIEKTVIIRSMQDKGVSEEDISTLVGMKPWLYKNSAAPIARKHDVRSLVGYMGRLCKLDADVKSSSQSRRTLVEMTMLTIAQ